jgi:hypothetical protein
MALKRNTVEIKKYACGEILPSQRLSIRYNLDMYRSRYFREIW